MVTFYFHLRTDGLIAEDAEGSDLPDLEAAKREARSAAQEMVAAAVKHSRDDFPDSIMIADADGRELASITLADAIPKRLRS